MDLRLSKHLGVRYSLGSCDGEAPLIEVFVKCGGLHVRLCRGSNTIESAVLDPDTPLFPATL